MQRLKLISLLLLLPAFVSSNDFPTAERVIYVLNCMQELGGQPEDIHTCVCRIDTIADLMTFADYDISQTAERFKQMPGKKGGLFRDTDVSKNARKNLLAVRKSAEQRCRPTVHIDAPQR